MLQSDRWKQRLEAEPAHWSERIIGVFSTPLLEADGNGGWRDPAA
jgi:hypothetical protein